MEQLENGKKSNISEKRKRIQVCTKLEVSGMLEKLLIENIVRKKELQRLKARWLIIIHSTGHYAPLIKTVYKDNTKALEIAQLGARVGDKISAGKKAEVESGNNCSFV